MPGCFQTAERLPALLLDRQALSFWCDSCHCLAAQESVGAGMCPHKQHDKYMLRDNCSKQPPESSDLHALFKGAACVIVADHLMLVVSFCLASYNCKA